MIKTLKEVLEKEVSENWVEDGLFQMLFRIMFFAQIDVMWVYIIIFNYKSFNILKLGNMNKMLKLYTNISFINAY